MALGFSVVAFNEDFGKACFQAWKVINFLKYAEIVHKMWFSGVSFVMELAFL